MNAETLTVISSLQMLPEAIRTDQEAYDRADGKLQSARLALVELETQLELRSLCEPSLDDGNGGKRLPKNADERKLALQLLQAGDPAYTKLRRKVLRLEQYRDAAKQAYDFSHSSQSNIRLIAQLMIAEVNRGSQS